MCTTMLSGKIVEKTGPTSYRVPVVDNIWRCHTDQLLAGTANVHVEMDMDESYTSSETHKDTPNCSPMIVIPTEHSLNSRRYPV